MPKKIILFIIFVVILGGILYLINFNGLINKNNELDKIQQEEIISKVNFSCLESKSIYAEFFKESVKTKLSDGREVKLNQVISASGARYANKDESFVFWTKGDGAFVMENNEMTFKECVAEDDLQSKESFGNDKIRVFNPLPEQEIESPLIVRGEARGGWFFEADFPVVLTNWDGLIIGEAIASTQEDWMIDEFVEFEAVLEFEKPSYKNNGTIIFQKDNPSGLSENDDALEFTIYFK